MILYSLGASFWYIFKVPDQEKHSILQDTLGHGWVVGSVVLSYLLDLEVLRVFINLNDSKILQLNASNRSMPS